MLKITKNQGSIQVTADKSGFYPFDGTITFPTNSLFTATSANTDMITFKSTSNGDVQFVGNYKDITISGRSYDTKQKFLTAFSNLANQGSVDAYTKAETDAKLNEKQGKLKAGDGITLTEDATDNTTVVKTKLTMDRGPFNDDGIMIGRAAQLETSHGIAFGDESLSKYRGIAIGYKAQSRGTSSIVIGENSSDQDGAAVGTFRGSGVVIGHNARGGGAGVVIGTGAHGGGAGAVIGSNSTVDGNGYGYAIGDNVHISETTNMVPIAIGYGAVADETKPLAITILKVSDTDNDGTPEMKYCDFIQGDANGKLSILKGDGSDERIVIQDALSAGGSGGTVDAYTKAETDTKLEAKQDKLTAGSGITIDENNVISSTGGSGGTVDGLVIDVNKVTVGLEQELGNSSDSVVIGNKAIAYSSKSVLIGQEAESLGTGSTAIGYGAKGKSIETIAVGYMATADGYSSIAIGDSSKNVGNYNVVIGPKAESTSNGAIGSVAIGWLAKSSARNGISIGYKAEATDTTPLVINAGKDSNYKPLTVLQSDATGKLSILKGDGTDERIVLQDALSAGGSGGSVDAYTKTETDNLLNAKQNTLTAGTGITIDENNVISSTGGSGGSANPYVNVKGTDSATITDTVTDAVAIGSGAKVTEELSVAIGAANALSGHCVAIGSGANATKMSSVAIGDGAMAQAHMFDVAIGFHAATTDTKPLEINAGYKTVGGSIQTLTVLQSDSDGKLSILKGDGTNERMVIQDEIEALKNAGGSGGSANPLVNVKGTNESATIADNVTSGIAIGSGASVTGDSGVCVGYKCASVVNSLAVGKEAYALGTSDVAIGNGANTKSSSDSSIAIGFSASANGSGLVAIGQSAETNDTTPLVINAGYCTDDEGFPQVLTVLQSDSNGKISIPLGNGTVATMIIQDEFAALKAEITTLKAEIAALKGGGTTGA